MAEEKNEAGFKVVDRRSFTEDGARREPTSVAEKKNEAPRPTTRPDTHSIVSDSVGALSSELGAAEEDDEEGAANFATLVNYLSTTVMFQLGLLPGPGGERIPADFPNARRTIDLLEVLQQKTQGNLTEEEARMLEEVLYELRLAFVETTQRQARKAK
jgi:hypothetical protein